MNKGYLMLPVAAMALAATSVSAFNSDMLAKAGLNDQEIAAFEEAKELRKSGDRDGARDVLAQAGIDMGTLEEIRNVMKAEREDNRQELEDILATGTYSDFQAIANEIPWGDKITSAADFAKLQEAYDLREQSRAIMDDLGIKPPEGNNGHRFGHPPQ